MANNNLIVAAAALVIAPLTQAGTLLDIQFDADAANLAAVTAQYGLVQSGTLAGASVSGGRLSMAPAGANGSLDFGAFAGDVNIRFDTSIADPGMAGGINVALRVGGHNIVFHPGYPGGAFRIDGVFGNTDMGFTPNVAMLNHFQVDIDAATGTFDIAITDGANPANVFVYQWVNAAYQPGTTVFGLSTGGSGRAWFDNLLVQSPAIPEPATWAMMVFGLAAAQVVRRRAAARA